MHNNKPSCFYRSNGSSIYEDGSGGKTKSEGYSGNQTVITTFNMNTGQIVWTVEGTSKVCNHTYAKLTSGTWIFTIVSYGAKVELLKSNSE